LRYLILSDLHSNGEALAAVLARAGRRPYDCLVVLGDLVGYGADPNEVVRRVRRVRRRKALVRGNHTASPRASIREASSTAWRSPPCDGRRGR
jgi:predicted phosphodiesterase